jgi:hypothetical protein
VDPRQAEGVLLTGVYGSGKPAAAATCSTAIANDRSVGVVAREVLAYLGLAVTRPGRGARPDMHQSRPEWCGWRLQVQASVDLAAVADGRDRDRAGTVVYCVDHAVVTGADP